MADVTSPVAVTAGKAASAAANKVLPTVVEHVELAVDVPSKLILNQRLVVVLSVVAGGALGAGFLYGFNKIRNRGKVLVAVSEDDE